jgi:hypothetical protein
MGAFCVVQEGTDASRFHAVALWLLFLAAFVYPAQHLPISPPRRDDRHRSAMDRKTGIWNGGWGRNRTGVRGVAVRCMTTLPPSLYFPNLPGRQVVSGLANAAIKDAALCMACGREFGAGNETRTRDPDLGKVVLYQLSYSRIFKLSYFLTFLLSYFLTFLLSLLSWLSCFPASSPVRQLFPPSTADWLTSKEALILMPSAVKSSFCALFFYFSAFKMGMA